MDGVKASIESHNRKNKLRFDPESHTYAIKNNQVLPSVTERISSYFPFDLSRASRMVAEKQGVYQDEVLEYWEYLRNAGTRVHELAERYCSNQDISPQELEYIRHVRDFFKEHPEFEIIDAEVKIFSQKFLTAGTIDLIYRNRGNGRLHILDWKTSQKEITKNSHFNTGKSPFSHIPNNKFHIYSLQLAAYMHILKEEYGIEIWDSMIVHLKDDQTYTKIEPMNLLCEAEELLSIVPQG
ncbi:PD-(D/E)XK nuclease family protein [Candidatus Woesearchaeota archaeon]|nr:PD-(D/E)XK nuclease family protein [Candidatus Woesearchaeota archaeon]